MAVSLAHIRQEASRRRATTAPSQYPPPPPPQQQYNPNAVSMGSNMAGFYPPTVPPQPQQRQRHTTAPSYPAANEPWVGIPVAPMDYAPEHRYKYQPGIEFGGPTSCCLQQPDYYQSPVKAEGTERPALPPRPSKFQQPPSPHDSVHSSSASSSADTAPSFRTSIEPDPLPPHSNPQALSQTQSEAFTGSTPVADLSLGFDEIWSTSTGLADFRITRDASHLPKKFSSKPLLTVTRTANGQVLGTVKFHTFTSNNIEIILPSGRRTSISHSGLLHDRWGFQALSSVNTVERRYWKRDKGTGGAMLENSRHKHGEVLARLEGDRLRFIRPRMREEEVDEVVLSAVAMAEAARRGKKGADLGGNLGRAVGEMMGGSGGGSGG